MWRLVHIYIDMGSDDADRPAQIRRRWEICFRRAAGAVVSGQRFGNFFFQCQGHSEFSLPPLQAILKELQLSHRLAANGDPAGPSCYFCLTTQKPARVQLMLHYTAISRYPSTNVVKLLRFRGRASRQAA
jgi:hypothetical protein